MMVPGSPNRFAALSPSPWGRNDHPDVKEAGLTESRLLLGISPLELYCGGDYDVTCQFWPDLKQIRASKMGNPSKAKLWGKRC
jgi:hypothetical protein